MSEMVLSHRGVGEPKTIASLAILVRQGASKRDLQTIGDSQGKTHPLTDDGKYQAGSAGLMINNILLPLSDSPIKVIHTSPTLRARQTAEIISGQFGAKVEVEPLLADRDLRELREFKFSSTQEQSSIILWQMQHGYPNIESWNSIISRANQFIQKVSSLKVVIAVSNPEIIRAVLSSPQKTEMEMSEHFMSPGSLNLIDLADPERKTPRNWGLAKGTIGYNITSFDQL